MTPFEALYEYPSHHLTTLPDTSHLSSEAQETVFEKGQMVSTLQHHLQLAQDKMKKQADKHRTPREFAIGDMVYLKMLPQREKALGHSNPLKLASKWYDPFKVLQTVGKHAYKLKLPEGTQLHDVFHVSHLKKHIGDHVVPNLSLPLLTPSGKLKWFPIKVLQRRQIPRSIGEYDIAIPQWLV
jgi:hypothetical protein